jgi:type I restriction enzyme S subunit
MHSMQSTFFPMIDEAGHGTKRFPTERWRDLILGIPPIEEQRQVVTYLDGATAHLGSAVETAQNEIALLREYRTRLIADVVTGKLDVREAAARLPDAVPLESIEDDPGLSDETEASLEDADA